jgi:hypothetical protein
MRLRAAALTGLATLLAAAPAPAATFNVNMTGDTVRPVKRYPARPKR